MTHIARSLRRAVIRRAGRRCEYCKLSQAGQEAEFHLDHVVPAVLGGRTELANLALACVSCSLRKGARRAAVDPDTGVEAPLFSPRTDLWSDHFRFDGIVVAGLTGIGRSTIAALRLNRPLIIAIRSEETLRGRHPPP